MSSWTTSMEKKDLFTDLYILCTWLFCFCLFFIFFILFMFIYSFISDLGGMYLCGWGEQDSLSEHHKRRFSPCECRYVTDLSSHTLRHFKLWWEDLIVFFFFLFVCLFLFFCCCCFCFLFSCKKDNPRFSFIMNCFHEQPNPYICREFTWRNLGVGNFCFLRKSRKRNSWLNAFVICDFLYKELIIWAPSPQATKCVIQLLHYN